MKFPWRMMLISMEDVRVLLEFFRNHVVSIKRGAKVLLERIEDFQGLAPGAGGVVDFSGIGSPAALPTPHSPMQVNHDESMTSAEDDATRASSMASQVIKDNHFE